MKFAIVIPARKGSKAIRNKNLIKIKNKHLIEYSFIEAKKTRIKLKFILSNDEKIKSLSKKYGFISSYERPESVSKDTTSMSETILHFIDSCHKKFKFDYIVILQPTSPLRTARDIKNSINFLKLKKAKSLIGVSRCLEHPYEQIVMDRKKWKPLFKKAGKYYRRQDFDIKPYFINGAIYITEVSNLIKTKKIFDKDSACYIMPKLNSLDINDYEDLDILKKII